MGNAVSSFVSGFFKSFADFFGAPLDFLSGKACRSVCSSTWDLICYIENFCVSNLLKLLAVLVLLYIVLLFVYLLYKIGICDCLTKGLCKMMWACFSSCYNALEYGCMFVWLKFRQKKRMREDFRDIEDYISSSSEDQIMRERPYAYLPRSMRFRRMISMSSRERRRGHIERSLRPRSHRMGIGVSSGSVYVNGRFPGRHVKTVHDIRVTKTSKFVQKGNGTRMYRRR